MFEPEEDKGAFVPLPDIYGAPEPASSKQGAFVPLPEVYGQPAQPQQPAPAPPPQPRPQAQPPAMIQLGPQPGVLGAAPINVADIERRRNLQPFGAWNPEEWKKPETDYLTDVMLGLQRGYTNFANMIYGPSGTIYGGRTAGDRTLAESVTEGYRPDPRLQEARQEEGGIASQVIQGISALPADLPRYTLTGLAAGNPILGMAAADALARSGEPGATPEEATIAGLKGATLGAVTGPFSKYSAPARIAANAATGAALAVAEGGDLNSAISSGIVMAGLAATHGKQHPEIKPAEYAAWKTIRGEPVTAEDIVSHFRDVSNEEALKVLKSVRETAGGYYASPYPGEEPGAPPPPPPPGAPKPWPEPEAPAPPETGPKRGAVSDLVSQTPLEPIIPPEEGQPEIPQAPPAPAPPPVPAPAPAPEPAAPAEPEGPAPAFTIDEFAQGQMGRPFKKLSPPEQEFVKKLYDQVIAQVAPPEPAAPVQEPAAPEDPLAWTRAMLSAGHELQVSQIQRKFGLGYGKARDILMQASRPPEVAPPPATIVGDEQQPHGPEPEPGRGPGLPVDTIGEGGERGEVPPDVRPVPEPATPEGARKRSTTSVLIPGTQIEYPAEYKLRELADLRASHHGFSFVPEPEYPYQNERDYSKQENQWRVTNQGRFFKTRYAITDNPDAVNGPPIVDTDGNAFGGNSRLMTMQRVYNVHPEHAEAYRNYLREEAAHYGLDPAEVDAMKQPVLVREVPNQDNVKQIISLLNKTGTAAMSSSEKALSDSERVSNDTLTYINDAMEQEGEKATLADVLRSHRGPEIVQHLVNDGLITEGERPAYLESDNTLSIEGKTRIRRLLTGRFFSSVAQFDGVPDKVHFKLERIAAPMARLAGRPEWNTMLEPIREGLRALYDAENHGISKLEDLNAQEGMYGQKKYSPEALAWAAAIKNNSARTLGKAFSAYQDMERLSRPGEVVGMFDPEPVPQPEAFTRAFGDLDLGSKKRSLMPGAEAAPAGEPLESAPLEDQQSFFTPEEEAGSKQEEESRQAKLLGERLTAQFASGMAAKPTKLKPAQQRGMFEEEGPEQEPLFARRKVPEQLSLFDDLPDLNKPLFTPPDYTKWRLPDEDIPGLIKAYPTVWTKLSGPQWRPGMSIKTLFNEAKFQPIVIGNYRALKTNKQGMQLLRDIRGLAGEPAYGSAWPPRLVDHLIPLFDMRMSWIGHRAHGIDEGRVKEIHDTLENTYKKGQPLIFFRGDLEMPKEDMVRTVAEEVGHAMQMEYADAHENHIDHERLLNSPAGQKAVKFLTRNRYKTTDAINMGFEVGVRLMNPGVWKTELGLSEHEAIDLAELYTQLLHEKHGARARPVIERVYNALGKRYQPHETGTQAQTPDAGQRSIRQAEPLRSYESPAKYGPRRVPPASGEDYGDLARSREAPSRPEVEPLARQPEEPERGGPDNGPLLGSGLGALHPYVMKGLGKIKGGFGEMLAENQKRLAGEARKDLAKPTPGLLSRAKDYVRLMTGQRDVWKVSALQDIQAAEQHLPTKTEREALTLYRDFKSRPGKLKEWLDGTSPDLPGNTGWPKDPAQLKEMQDNRAHVDKWIKDNRTVIEQALNPTKGMLMADNLLTALADGTLREAQNQGIHDSTIKPEDYVPHMYHQDDPNQPLYEYAPAGKTDVGRHFQFGQERKYPTMLHGIAQGMSPRSMDALDAFRIHADKFATARATRMLVRSLLADKVVPAHWASSAQSTKVPPGYVKLGPGSRVFEFHTPQGIPQRLYVPKFMADALAPVTEPSSLRQSGFFSGMRDFQSRAKLLDLSLSLFHPITFAKQAVASMGRPWKPSTYGQIAKAYYDSIRDKPLDPAMLAIERRMVKNGGTSSLTGEMRDAYAALEPAKVPTRADVLMKAPGLKQLDTAAKKITDFTFQQLGRRLKIIDYGGKELAWDRKHPNATQAEKTAAYRSFAEYANNIYGGQHWENMGIGKTSQELLRALMLAPDWVFSEAHSALQAKERTPGGEAARKYWISAYAHAFAGSQLLSLAINHKPSPSPWTHPFQVYHGKDENGEDMWGNTFLAGAPNDVARFVKAVGTGDFADLGKMALAKSAPGLREAVEMGTGRDYYGRDIVNKNLTGPQKMARWAGHALVSAPMPFTFRTALTYLTDKYKAQYDEASTPNQKKLLMTEFLQMLTGLSQQYKHEAPEGMYKTHSGLEYGEPPESERKHDWLGGVLFNRP